MSEGALSSPVPAVKVNRSRTVLFTGLWFVGNQFLNLGQQILIVPLYLKYWGPAVGLSQNSPSLYGDWLELSSLTSYWFGMADAGMQAFVVNRLTGHYAQEKWQEFRADLASAGLMYLLVMSTALLVLISLTLTLPIGEHFQTQGRPLAPFAATVFGCLGAAVLVQIVSGFVSGLYRAMGQANKSPRVGFIQRSCFLLGTVLVLLLHGQPQHLALMQLSIAIVAVLWVAYDTQRIDKRVALTLQGARWKTARGFLAPSFMFLILDLGRGLTIQGMTVVVTETLGSAVLFNTTRTMANFLRQITTVISNTVWPELTRINARGDKERLVLGHLLVVKLTSVLALIPAAILFFSGTAVYQFWTRGRSVADETLLRLFLVDLVVGTPALASVVILQATSQVRSIAAFQSIAGVINVVACYFLVRYMGLAGAAIAPLLMTVVLFGTWVPSHVQQHLGQPVRDYWIGIYLPLALISAATFLACGATHRLIHGWVPALIVEGVVASVFALGLSVPFLFSAKERTFGTTIMRRLVRR
jgi:O-antigen/teichoic acid export membrane protein